ncbi:DUF1566 domain-containing protein, partial [Desulfobacterales bacterium HSG17]|nr:DUF1566 domain-containing protein [Desulfobacterales bacterium HSG17]
MKKATKIKTLSIILIMALTFNTFNTFAWPIPDTGQTKCYDNTQEITCPQPGEPFYGQDGNYTINPPSYTKLDASGNDLPDDAAEWFMVRDNVTGLIWEVKQNMDGVQDYSNPHDADNEYTWYDSNPETNGGNAGTPGDGTDTEDFIIALNTENYLIGPSWRLPTRMELRSIANYGREFPAIDIEYFPNIKSTYWTSSIKAIDASVVWIVDLTNGYDIEDFKSRRCYGLAVRGDLPKSFDHLINNCDGTVTDTATGLMWQQVGSAIQMSWSNALEYCKNLFFSEHNDWRLPDLKEIDSIVDLNQYSPSIDTGYFLNTNLNYYWSSSTFVSNMGTVWGVGFDAGNVYGHNDPSSRYVYAVRGGQSRILGHLFISSPNQAARWHIGDQKIITWDTQNIQGNVQISLSRQGGKQGTFETIAESTENSGTYTWTVTSPESFNCALKIEPINEPDKGNTQSLFTICNLKNAWVTADRIKTPDKYRLTLNGKYTDGIIPIEAAWSTSDTTIASIQNAILTGLQNGWVEVSTIYRGNIYTKGLFVYTTYETMEAESNNTSVQSFPITEGTFYEATIPFETDTDYFKITLPSDSIIDIGFLSKSTTADLKIEILDSSEILMASGTSINGKPLIFPLGLSAGIYYVKATSAGDIDENNPYIITYKIQDTLSTKTTMPLNMGGTAQSVINHLQDESLFTFNLSEPQAVKIDLTPSGDQAKYRMELLNSAGTVIDSVDCPEHAPVSLEGAYPSDTYTVRVLPLLDIDAKAQFTISLNPSSKQLETEPNDTADTSTNFNIASPISARLSDAADTDVFFFNL